MAYVGFVLPDGSEHLVPITDNYKEATDDKVVLSWIVGNEATAQPGRIAIAIKISGLEGELWKSEKAYCTVADTIPMESTQPEIFRSTNIPSNVVALPRTTNPDTEPPITVSERTIIVPQELQNIAVQNDQNSETVKIVCPRYFDGNDLSQYDFYLHTISTGGENPDIVFLGENKVVGQTEVTLVWTLKPPETSYAGRLTIQLKISGINFQWSTDSTSVNIIRYQEGDPVIPVTPSFVDEFLKEITIIKNSAKESQVAANASEKNAETSATNAKNSANESKKFSDNAQAAKTDAETAAAAAKADKEAAAASAKDSADSAAAALESKEHVDEVAEHIDQIAGGEIVTKVNGKTPGSTGAVTVTASDVPAAAGQTVQQELDGLHSGIWDAFNVLSDTPKSYTASWPCVIRPSFVGRTVQDGTPSPDSPAPIRGVLNPWARAYTGEAVQVTADVEPMIALPDGTQDRIVLRDGVWGIERNVLKVVLDGTENWYASDNGITYWTKSHIAGVSIDNIFCNRFTPTNNIDNPPVNSVFSWCEDSNNKRFTGTVFVIPSESIVPRNNVQALKAWLAANPITVYGPAAIPTFEPITAWNIYGKINPVAVTTTITKPNPDAPISPDNIAMITGTPVVTTGYRGLVRQLEGELFSGDGFNGADLTTRMVRTPIDGTRDWSFAGDAQGVLYFSTSVPGLKMSTTGSELSNALCNKFQQLPHDIFWSTPGPAFSAIRHLGHPVLSFRYDSIQSVDAWKAKLAEWAAAGQPLEVVCELATPAITRHNMDLPLTPGDWVIEAGDDNGLLEGMDITVLPDPATYGNRIYPYQHAKAGNVHQLTGTPGAAEISFAATATYQDGDTWTINGTPVAATYADGQALLPTAVIAGESVWAVLEGDALRLMMDKPTPQRNLLDNGLFDAEHLINQQGQNSYISESTTSYGPDMWRLVGVNAEVQSDGVRVYRPGIGGYGWVDQPTELLKTYRGKTITLAVMMDGKTLVTTAQIPIDPPTYIDCGAIQLPTGDRWTIGVEGETGRMNPKLYIAAGQSYKIQAVKLEPGPRFTGWDSPKPGETLAECQRYFYKFKGEFFVGPFTSGSAATCVFPTTMRVVPAITNVVSDQNWGTPIVHSVSECAVTFEASTPAIVNSFDAIADL